MELRQLVGELAKGMTRGQGEQARDRARIDRLANELNGAFKDSVVYTAKSVNALRGELSEFSTRADALLQPMLASDKAVQDIDALDTEDVGTYRRLASRSVLTARDKVADGPYGKCKRFLDSKAAGDGICLAFKYSKVAKVAAERRATCATGSVRFTSMGKGVFPVSSGHHHAAPTAPHHGGSFVRRAAIGIGRGTPRPGST